jgi:hypothetical protein
MACPVFGQRLCFVAPVHDRSLQGRSALHSARSRRLVVTLLAAIALIAASVVYSRHDLGNRLHEQGHCDLCSHFSGASGSRDQPVVASKPVLVVHLAALPSGLILPTRRKAGVHLPRGPPHSLIC